MLMAAAAGRNLGKTEFLCRAIRAQSRRRRVIGIKITAIDDALADYRAIPVDHLVLTASPGGSNKDTDRMYQAGAARVYWLRVKRPAFQAGLTALFETMEQEGIDLNNDCLVCESGGARKWIEPGLFLMIQGESKSMKPTCAELLHLADRLVNFKGQGWDLCPDTLAFEKHRWGLKEQAAAIVMSGGQSRRMGTDKSTLALNGKPMLSTLIDQLNPNVNELLISGSPRKYTFTGCRVIEDHKPQCGPLMGLWSTLQASNHELNFVVACDVPRIHLPLLRRMVREIGDHDAVVPIIKNQQQPLFALYRKRIASTIERLLHNGRRSMHALLEQIDLLSIEIKGDWYYNLNTPEEFERYQRNHS